MSERYPLSWPDGWKRITPANRTSGRFSKETTRYGEAGQSWKNMRPVSVNEAITRIQSELDKLGVRDGDAVISTNIPTRLDGLPRSNQGEPEDPGAAVYWILKNRKECMAIDRYNRVADNLAAIAATLEALRTVERHGGAEILERAFRGFTALPERAGGKSWREILKFPPLTTPTSEMVKDHFRKIAADVHPDKEGGSRDSFEELIWARDQALRELNGSV